MVKYRLNGKTPLEWAMGGYKFTTDEGSDITNDSTKIEIITLIEQLVYIRIESDRLVSLLPGKFESDDWEPDKTRLDASPSE